MNNLKTFEQFINENDDGGGVAFATPNANGMGNVVAPTVGTTPGSVWQSGSGTIGSGDMPAYDMGDRFDFLNNMKKRNRKRKRKDNRKEKVKVFSNMPW